VIGFYPAGASSSPLGQQPSSTQVISGTKAQAVKAASLAVNGRYFGPYPTQAAAQAAIKSGKLTGNQGAAAKGAGAVGQAVAPTFNLVIRNISGWFFRGLKIVFGAAMIIAGISKMTGVDNKITQLAGKLPVIPV
jgi:hypothetical protein